MAPIIPFLPLIAAGVGAATTAVALAEQPSLPTATQPTSTQSTSTQAQVSDAAAQAQAANLAQRRGLASTILTSPMGAASAVTTKPTLGA